MLKKSMQNENIYEAYGQIDFGDTRLSRRYKRTLETLHKDPGLSICGASNNRHEAKAIYRLIKNTKIAIEPMIEASKSETIKRIIDSGANVILLPQDTTELDFTGLKACEGLGVHGSHASNRGVIMHSSIAVSPEGMVFGLMSQELWVRPPEEHGKSNDRRKRPIEEKESRKWLDTMDKSMNNLPENITVVTVCDREGDMFDLFHKAELENKSYLVRIVQNRLTTEAEKVLDYAKSLTCRGTCTVHIPRDTRNRRSERDAKLSIKHAQITIKAPCNSNFKNGETVTAYVIAAEEIDAPSGVEPISWYLLTNVMVNNFDEACEKVAWYVQRWKIERFHYILKNVSNIEKSQERDVEKLKKVIVMKTIISMMIMILMYLSRSFPNLPCDIVFDENEWKFLYMAANESANFPPSSSHNT